MRNVERLDWGFWGVGGEMVEHRRFCLQNRFYAHLSKLD